MIFQSFRLSSCLCIWYDVFVGVDSNSVSFRSTLDMLEGKSSVLPLSSLHLFSSLSWNKGLVNCLAKHSFCENSVSNSDVLVWLIWFQGSLGKIRAGGFADNFLFFNYYGKLKGEKNSLTISLPFPIL